MRTTTPDDTFPIGALAAYREGRIRSVVRVLACAWRGDHRYVDLEALASVRHEGTVPLQPGRRFQVMDHREAPGGYCWSLHVLDARTVDAAIIQAEARHFRECEWVRATTP
jgi:hypothetical protein